MSYTGPCTWVEQLSAFCDPKVGWKDPEDMHHRCAGTFIARNPPPSGTGRTYGRCPCLCHRKSGQVLSEEQLERYVSQENESLDRQTSS